MSIQVERWGTRVGLVLAVAGNAVGLGNFLRFPAQAVQNGGGAFIIPYLVSFILMGIPMLWVEWAIGRRAGRYGHHSSPGALDVLSSGRMWKYIGVFGIFTNLTVAAYYSYIESWTLAYVWYSMTGTFSGMSATQVSDFFSWYLGSDQGLLSFSAPAVLFFAVTLGINLWILSRGLRRGVELASKIGMPILIVFGIFLAVRALTLEAGEHGAMFDAVVGLNFLWTPQFDSLANPKIWLAAAGQIFFTLAVGLGSIHCYASYVRERDDIALNASAAGWTNEFVEIILGSSIIIPIAVAYLGLDWLQDNVGFEMGFRTMPTLFEQWGAVFSTLAGVAWFGLLFFAGITSSLAMGQPVLAFLQDELRVSRNHSVIVFGVAVVMLALPCVLLYNGGAFAEFDYWAGTFSLVVFALAEVILFAWVFGMDKGWEEITRGADMRVPKLFRYVIQYVTPMILLFVFLGALFSPMDGDWSAAVASLFAGEGWPLAADSVIGSVLHIGIEDTRWFIDGEVTRTFIIDMTRLLLLGTFFSIAVAVYFAFGRRDRRIVQEKAS